MSLFESTPGLARDEWDSRFQQTHVGQVHFAGTGPKGRTCRECKFYGQNAKRWPDYYEAGASRDQLMQATCGKPMPGKVRRKFPHSALACSLFEPIDNPPPVNRPKEGTKQ